MQLKNALKGKTVAVLTLMSVSDVAGFEESNNSKL